MKAIRCLHMMDMRMRKRSSTCAKQSMTSRVLQLGIKPRSGEHTKVVAPTFEIYENMWTILVYFWQRGHSLDLCCLLQSGVFSRLLEVIHFFYHILPCQEFLALATDANRFVTESRHVDCQLESGKGEPRPLRVDIT